MKSPVLAGLWLCASLVLADTYPRQPGVDVRHYIFRISLSDGNDEIAGETTVDLCFVKDGVTQFALDLTSVKNGKGMTVLDVTAGGSALSHAHTADRLMVTLPGAPKAGECRQFTVKYRGIPRAGLKFVKNKYGERGMFSANWPDRARQWLPTIDHPYDKATSEFIVTAPARYQVVSNGVLEEQIDLGDGRRVTHWRQSVPIATWLWMRRNSSGANFPGLLRIWSGMPSLPMSCTRAPVATASSSGPLTPAAFASAVA